MAVHTMAGRMLRRCERSRLQRGLRALRVPTAVVLIVASVAMLHLGRSILLWPVAFTLWCAGWAAWDGK